MTEEMPFTLPELLRAWRERVSLLSGREAAALIGVTPAALSQWETGKRRPDTRTVEQVDAAYGAQGCLSDFSAALSTPNALPRMAIWLHNFPADGGPVWTWVRCPVDAEATVLVGPFAVTLPIEGGMAGLVITARDSFANPPIHVRLNVPGWSDFGRGVPPPELGLPICEGADRGVVLAHSDPMLRYSAKRLTDMLGRRIAIGRTKRLVPPEAELDSIGPVRGFFSRKAVGVAETVVEGCGTGKEVPLELASAEEIRRARGLSRQDVAGVMTRAYPSSPVSDDQVELFENGRLPRPEFFTARLDMALGARGLLTRDTVRVTGETAGTRTVHFPTFWVGSVWLTFAPRSNVDQTSRTTAMRLLWPPWQKPLRVAVGSTVTFRRSLPTAAPLRVTLPPSWQLTAGLGRPTEAVDVNEGWTFFNLKAANEIFVLYGRVALAVLGHRPTQLDRLVRTVRRRGHR